MVLLPWHGWTWPAWRGIKGRTFTSWRAGWILRTSALGSRKPAPEGKGSTHYPSPLASTSLERCAPLSELDLGNVVRLLGSVTPTVGSTGPNQGRLREVLLVSLRNACYDTFRFSSKTT